MKFFNLSLFLVLVLFSCRKNSDALQFKEYQIEDLKDWINTNGGNFKDGKIHLKNVEGEIETGNLDWLKAKEILYKQNSYLLVPFNFQRKFINLSESDSTIVNRSYNLVFRKKNNKIECALEFSSIGFRETLESKKLVLYNSITYQSIEGKVLSARIQKGNNNDYVLGRQITSNKNIAINKNNNQLDVNNVVKANAQSNTITSSSSNSESSMSCYTLTLEHFEYYNYWDGDELIGVSYPVRDYVSICNGGGGEMEMEPMEVESVLQMDLDRVMIRKMKIGLILPNLVKEKILM